MQLLARTQSLSGRPHDALVMLRRLAQLGYRVADIETSDDFTRVRSLGEWPDLLATARTALSPAPAPPSAPVARATVATNDALPVPRSIVSPVTMAYDAVSRRFVLADDSSDALKIVDQLTANTVNLTSVGWAGEYRPAAIAIDTRRGDLWAAGVNHTGSALHRLQLISGRLLQTIVLPADQGAAKFVDVAIGGARVFVLDALGRRLYALTSGSSTLRLLTRFESTLDAISMTVGTDAIYVAHPGGIVRVDLATHAVMPVKTTNGLRATDLRSIRWQNNSLFGVQQTPDGRYHPVRIRLDRAGTTATAIDVLGLAASPASTIAGGVFYYLAPNTADDGVVFRHSPAR